MASIGSAFLIGHWNSAVRLNLSDLNETDLDQLCQLQTHSTNYNLSFDPENCTVEDLVESLNLDSYASHNDLILVPFWFKTTAVVLFTVCFLWSCALNLRTLVAIAINQSCWSSTNVLIALLAVSDLVTLCTTAPTEVSNVATDIPIWNLGDFGCYFVPFLQTTAIMSNALILCLIAYDRYVCIVKMEHFTRFKPTWFTLVLMASVWIVSIGIALPAFWLWLPINIILTDNIAHHEFGVDFCTVFPVCVSNPTYAASSTSFYYVYYACLCGAIFCPLFLLFVVIYGRIGYFLWLRKPVGSGSGARNQLRRKKKIAVALLGLILAFFLCRMPNWMFVMAYMTHWIVEMTPTISMVNTSLIFLSVLNTALNPLLYVLVDEPMTKTLKHLSNVICTLLEHCNSYCLEPKEEHVTVHPIAEPIVGPTATKSTKIDKSSNEPNDQVGAPSQSNLPLELDIQNDVTGDVHVTRPPSNG